MAHIEIMPLLAETMDEGTIARWLVSEGAEVKKGDPLVEVETDKANMEVTATAGGILRRIVAPEGKVVPVNDPIAIIGEADEALPELSGSSRPGEQVQPADVPAAAAAPAAAAGLLPDMKEGRMAISPRARKLAEQRGIAPEELAGLGSGPGGRIVERDVEGYAAQRPAATPLAEKMAAAQGVGLDGLAGSGPGGKIYSRDLAASSPAAGTAAPYEVIRLAGMRKTIADRLSASAHSSVPVTLTSEVDMTAVVSLRGRLLPEVERVAGVRLTYTDIIVKAVARALSESPAVNSTLEGDEIRLHSEINVGVAVALEQGLIVPVIRQADRLGLAGIALAAREMAGKAREGKISAADMSGGTFTVTNLGTYGVEAFTPVINPPQSCILGIGAIIEKPAVVAGEILPRSMMYLSLVFDHRALDGAPAARFLQRVKALLEMPELMIL